MQQVTIATFNDLSSAQQLKERFAKDGIPVELYDERKLQRFWFLSPPLAGIRLKVPTEKYESARKLYQELNAAHDKAVRAAIRCPKCRSSRIEYPQMTRHFILPTLLGHVAFLLGYKRKFYCQECQFTWPIKGNQLPKTHSSPLPTSLGR